MLAYQCPQIKLRKTVLSNVFLAWNIMFQMNWTSVLFHQSDLTYCLEMLLWSWLVSPRFLKWTILFKLCGNKVFSSFLITKMLKIKLKHSYWPQNKRVLFLKFWHHVYSNIIWLKLFRWQCWSRTFTKICIA